jgi:hypothetical protein
LPKNEKPPSGTITTTIFGKYHSAFDSKVLENSDFVITMLKETEKPQPMVNKNAVTEKNCEDFGVLRGAGVKRGSERAIKSGKGMPCLTCGCLPFSIGTP